MTLNTDNKFYHLLRAFRPRQWIKNGVVFAPLVFHGVLFESDYFFRASLAFIYFCGVASAIYLINDIWDIERDKLHPIKKNRPIASGAVSVKTAWITVFVLLTILIPTSFIIVGKYFGFVLLAYVLVQFAYNLKLKDVIILDALTISIGFILRAFAGAMAIPLSISSWLILAITGVSLLLAFGKRRAERTLLDAQGISKTSTRSILKHYPDNLLDSMISMSASFSIITYSLFAFQTSPEREIGSYFVSIIPSTLIGAKLLMLTIPIVIYGVARYLYVIYEKREGESPERVLLSDAPLLYATVIWGIAVIIITNL
ncbi:decaprenyl-phosphate phosphoribosyltransferase [candidate division WWE3 bacterium CG_4_9_14_3_um_filter_34_6]|uniref:Decaprenyl-phosphate phosphoribosyltransferase n=1 Tax=candidate division WWE3 bacterium CG_4_9_14_3_um_filter_34_6 TaxID=1975079 RepID=A0A2M7X373_UNCKA|nr:MAG: decaprenyl-phosphate phosphoribosyltransferase [candidate division WWE3 bacterium CG_4_9_14_3_um_filter_34_6]